jgi:hypothetical protein
MKIYPIKIKEVYDNEGDSFDRYTIVTNQSDGKYSLCLCLNENPDSPQGFSQFSDCISGPHLGKKIKFTDLPSKVRIHAKKRLT